MELSHTIPFDLLFIELHTKSRPFERQRLAAAKHERPRQNVAGIEKGPNDIARIFVSSYARRGQCEVAASAMNEILRAGPMPAALPI